MFLSLVSEARSTGPHSVPMDPPGPRPAPPYRGGAMGAPWGPMEPYGAPGELMKPTKQKENKRKTKKQLK